MDKITVNAALKRRDKIREIVKNIKLHFLELGLELSNALEAKDYKTLGYNRFEEYIKAEYDLKSSTAWNLIGIVNDYGQFILEDSSLIDIDYSKLAILRSITKGLHEDKIREWLIRSKPLSHRKLRALISETKTSKDSSTATVQYGKPFHFRGLLHEPINEHGVIFIFGMICSELGYSVESIHRGFPDCEAKKKISKRSDRWTRIRIEFEFHSKNFLQHGHDPTGCDLIVCWEHDWPECPIEVLELKSILPQLHSD